jgi:hypothetical protein
LGVYSVKLEFVTAQWHADYSRAKARQ